MSGVQPAEGGMRIGDYELVRRVGRGGMAEVWVAKKHGRARQQRYVAVKLMAENLAGQERYSRMFRAESDLAAMLTHANIVQVFDEGEEDGRSYLVMEWVDGINLVKLGAVMSLCDEELRDRIGAYVVGQLLHALAYAHSITMHDGSPLGIVHRDVSPQNVLISNHGDVKLTDFGVAHFVFDESSGMHVKGKVRYMSPEQLSGKTRAPTLDLWAAGAILHELVDGQRFRGDVDQQVMYRDILAGHVPPLSRTLPPELEAVRRGLLEPDPTKRIQTAENAIERLRLWSGYGEMKLELSRLCATMTGVMRPRTGPGMSGPAPRAAEAKPPRTTPAYGDAVPDPTPTVSLGQQEEDVPQPRPRGGTVLLPGSGLPVGVAMQDELREATTATSMVAGGATSPDLRVAIAEAREQRSSSSKTMIVIACAALSISIGAVVAWFAFADRGDAPEVAASEVVEAAPDERPPVEAAPERSSEDKAGDAGGLVIGSAVEKATPAPIEDTKTAVEAMPPAQEEGGVEGEVVEDEAAAEGEGVAMEPEEGESDAAEAERGTSSKRPSGTKPPRKPPASSSATVAVHVRLTGISRAEVRIGKRTITATPYFDGRLPVGRHRIKWREKSSDAWRTAGSFTFAEGSEYVVRASSNGLRLETR